MFPYSIGLWGNGKKNGIVMITSAVVFDHRGRAKKREEGPVEIRVTVDRKPYYVQTGVKILRQEFAGGSVVDRADADVLNERIRIIKSNVKFFNNFSDKCRAALLGSTTYGNYVIPTLIKILRDILRIMTTYINPYLRHHLDGKRMDFTGRPYSGRTYFCLRMKMLKDTMCHLAAASVACT